MLTKLITYFLLISTFTDLNAQLKSVVFSVPPTTKVSIQLLAYNGFKTDSFQNVNLDQSGIGKVNIKYSGFALIKMSNGKQYPIIIKNKNTQFIISDYDSIPVFTDDDENTFLYQNLLEKEQLLRKKILLADALSFFKDTDPFFSVLNEEKNIIETNNKHLKNKIANNTEYMAATLLNAKLLIEAINTIRTDAELNATKEVFISFINKNFNHLIHSDMIQQMAVQYVMMNEYVLIGQENHYKQVTTDIGDWINNFRKKIPPEDIVNFFIKFYLGRSMVGLTAMISREYKEYSKCEPISNRNKISDSLLQISDSLNISLSVNKNFSVRLNEMGKTAKILFLFQPDCPVCFVQQLMLGNYLQEQNQRIPAITVFPDEDITHPLSVLAKLQKEAFYYTKYCSLYQNANIDKYPAYLVLGKDNSIQQKFYMLEDLKKYINDNKLDNYENILK